MKKFYEMRRFYFLMAVMAIVMAIGFCTNARACDYGTELDPRLLRTDYVTINEVFEEVSGLTFRTLANRFNRYPEFVILCLEKGLHKGKVVSAYWYLNKEYELEVYAYLNTGHFGRTQFDPETERKITDGLLKLLGINNG